MKNWKFNPPFLIKCLSKYLKRGLKPVTILLFFVLLAGFSSAQLADKRYQYPIGLKDAYFGFSIGHINYKFTPGHLEQPFSVGAIEVPHTAVRFIIYGYRLNKNVSVQASYLRTDTFARYRNVND